MITIKNKSSLAKMEQAGLLLEQVFHEVASLVKPGVTADVLDEKIAQLLEAKGLNSKMRGYRGYKYVSCISVNEEVVHGLPLAQKILKDGDLVKIDVCASWNGYCADMARAYFVGNPSKEAQKLVIVAEEALQKGIAAARAGNRLSDISAAIQKEVERNGFGVVRDFAGHGIGKQMHEDPEIVNYGSPGKGPVLQPGMTFAIEPMITYGDYTVKVEEDGWTVRTADRSLAMHVEDTIAITQGEPKILTRSSAEAKI